MQRYTLISLRSFFLMLRLTHLHFHTFFVSFSGSLIKKSYISVTFRLMHLPHSSFRPHTLSHFLTSSYISYMFCLMSFPQVHPQYHIFFSLHSLSVLYSLINFPQCLSSPSYISPKTNTRPHTLPPALTLIRLSLMHFPKS